MNLQDAKLFTIELCKKAGEDIKRDFVSGKFTSTSKGGVDFLTDVDSRTDEFLRTSLVKQFPQTEFLTEESSDGDFATYHDTSHLWIIDPIDGTTNFSRGNPHFSISVALVSKGKTLLGVVYLPAEDLLYVADGEMDAAATVNGKPLAVSTVSELEKATLAFDWSWDIEMRKKTYQMLAPIFPVVRQSLTLGCASSDMCLVARGNIDGYFINGIKPWDIAASSLILEKAGGTITKIDGSAWNVFEPSLIASNGHVHKRMIEMLT